MVYGLHHLFINHQFINILSLYFLTWKYNTMSLWDYLPKAALKPLAEEATNQIDNVTRCKSTLSTNTEMLLGDKEYSQQQAQETAIQLQQIINSVLLLKSNMKEREENVTISLKGDDGYNKHLNVTISKKGVVTIVTESDNNDITMLCK